MRKDKEKKKLEEMARAGREQLIAMQAQLETLQKGKIEEDCWKNNIEEIEESGKEP